MRLIAVLSCMLLMSCATSGSGPALTQPGPDPMAEWKGQIFVGDHQRQAVVRGQSNTVIPTSDPRFGQMICIPYPDFTDLVSRIQILKDSRQ